jgi:hypothetical protein
MPTPTLIDKAYTKLQAAGAFPEGSNPKWDAASIEALLGEIMAEAHLAGVEVGIKQKTLARRPKQFDFDVAKLQKLARAKMLQGKLSWQQVSDACGITIAPLKQHLGDKPPAYMGLKVAASLMVFIGDFDLLTFLIEEPAA